MKKILLLAFFLVLKLCAFSQTEDLTQITNHNLNDVSIKIQRFLNEKLGINADGEAQLINNTNPKTATFKFLQSGAYNNKYEVIPKPMFIKYFFTVDKSGNPIIQQCKIYGDANSVIKFYISYWLTNINFKPSKKTGIFYTYYLADKAELSINSLKKYAALNIVNTQIMASSDRVLTQ